MIYVFQVRIQPGYSAEQYAQAWVATSTLIQRAPGARGTRLHRGIDDPDTLLAIASWDSKAARDAADPGADASIRAIIESQAPFVDITLVGEYEDPEWVVLPDG